MERVVSVVRGWQVGWLEGGEGSEGGEGLRWWCG